MTSPCMKCGARSVRRSHRSRQVSRSARRSRYEHPQTKNCTNPEHDSDVPQPLQPRRRLPVQRTPDETNQREEYAGAEDIEEEVPPSGRTTTFFPPSIYRHPIVGNVGVVWRFLHKPHTARSRRTCPRAKRPIGAARLRHSVWSQAPEPNSTASPEAGGRCDRSLSKSSCQSARSSSSRSSNRHWINVHGTSHGPLCHSSGHNARAMASLTRSASAAVASMIAENFQTSRPRVIAPDCTGRRSRRKRDRCRTTSAERQSGVTPPCH